MNFNKKLAIGGMAVLTAFSSVAQDDAKKEGSSNFMNTVSVGGAVGLSLLHGDMREYDWYPVGTFNSERSIGGHLFAQKTLNSVFGIQGQLYLAKVNGTRRADNLYSNSSVFETSLNLHINVSNLVAGGKSKDKKFGVYAYAGVGLSNFRVASYSLTGDEVNSFYGYTDNTLAEKDASTTETVFPFGFGVKYRVSNNINLFGETTWRALNSDKLDGLVQGGANDSYSLTSLGVVYSFGDRSEKNIDWDDPLDEAIEDIAEVKTTIDGMANDEDKDGVPDLHDAEPGTPEGVAVDGKGRALDVDGDGVADYMDQDNFSNPGAKVDENGVEMDADGDGVVDSEDLEPNTEKGAMVNFQGVTIEVDSKPNTGSAAASGLTSVYFDLNSVNISHTSYPAVAEVAQQLLANPEMKLTIVGHTDASGSASYNEKLGMRRAQAVIDHLVKIYGIDASRLTAESKGKAEPLAKSGMNNVNRRVDFIIQE
jgi:OOP family OmpA-OmpF porin